MATSIDVAQALRYGTCTLQPNGKYLCVCNTELLKASIKRHLASKRHLEKVSMLNRNGKSHRNESSSTQALQDGTCTLQPNGKYLCVCKTELMKASIKRHLASNKHLEEVSRQAVRGSSRLGKNTNTNEVAQALQDGTFTLQPNGKYLCVCKSEILKSSIKNHLATAKHKMATQKLPKETKRSNHLEKTRNTAKSMLAPRNEVAQALQDGTFTLQPNGKYLCVCKSEILKSSIKNHLVTAKHKEMATTHMRSRTGREERTGSEGKLSRNEMQGATPMFKKQVKFSTASAPRVNGMVPVAREREMRPSDHHRQNYAKKEKSRKSETREPCPVEEGDSDTGDSETEEGLSQGEDEGEEEEEEEISQGEEEQSQEEEEEEQSQEEEEDQSQEEEEEEQRQEEEEEEQSQEEEEEEQRQEEEEEEQRQEEEEEEQRQEEEEEEQRQEEEEEEQRQEEEEEEQSQEEEEKEQRQEEEEEEQSQEEEEEEQRQEEEEEEQRQEEEEEEQRQEEEEEEQSQEEEEEQSQEEEEEEQSQEEDEEQSKEEEEEQSQEEEEEQSQEEEEKEQSQELSEEESQQSKGGDNREISTSTAPYRMASQPRGNVYIFNYKFAGKHNYREGAEHDSETIQATFTNMGYRVFTKESLSRRATLMELKLIRDEASIRDVDSVIMFFLSHGKGVRDFLTEDGLSLCLSRIHQMFTDAQCPALRGKPKIFFTNFCRKGVFETCPVFEASDPPRDMVTIHASGEGIDALRNTAFGTYFIRNLCQVLQEHAGEKSLRDIYLELDRSAAERGGTQPMWEDFVFRNFYFSPTKTKTSSM